MRPARNALVPVPALALALALVLALAVASGLVAGCSSSSESTAALSPVRIGTLPTEDSLPLWVAERDGLFEKAGLKVTIQSFQSAQERDAALTAGAIDGFMGDLIAAGTLRSGGIPVKVVTVMLGATPKEGRFGIAVKPGSDVISIEQLAGRPIGTSSGTIQEYVLDSLMLQAGLGPDDIKKEEVKKVPVRFELLMSGKLEAAALPEPFLSLAQKQGAKIVADDTGDQNISQTVLVFSQKYLDTAGGSASVAKLLGVWDQAVEKVNAAPDTFRALLVDKAKIPDPLKDSYVVNTYPKAQLPKQEDVEAVLDWMDGAGLLPKAVTYDDLMWQIPK
ncbi:MAG TPA: ABC transporter substrate-binding protein [Coriobacteriia bacterium]